MSRDGFEVERQFALDALQESEKFTALNRQFQVVRAAEILLPYVDRLPDNTPKTSPAIEDFQEVLRIWPLSRDGEAVSPGVVDVKCPDCGAIFSSLNDLKQHYLTQFCPGAAIVVYIMIRDRVITKGYRIEKRLVPLYGRPLRLLCEECQMSFTVDDDQSVERRRNAPFFVFCQFCRAKCNISYSPVTTGFPDEPSFRSYRKDSSSCPPSRCSSIARKNFKFPQANGLGVEEFPVSMPGAGSKTHKLRNSLSFSRRYSQFDEDELVAISFAGPKDLEQVHAPNGIYEPIKNGAAGSPASKSVVDANLKADHGVSAGNTKRSTLLLCEKGNGHARNCSVDSECDSLSCKPISRVTSLSRKPSLFRRVFSRKTSKRVLHAGSATSNHRKLIKKTNTVRFSYVAKREKNDTNVIDGGDKEAELKPSQPDLRTTAMPDPERVALLIDSESKFIHVQSLSEGSIVHDVSGRQRVLSMDQIARVFLHVRHELSAGAIWSKTVATRFRAEMALKEGNVTTAVAKYHEALKLLDDTPALDSYKLSKAGMLHRLGQAYGKLDMHADSEACYLEALGLYKRSLGRDHAKNFMILHELGALCEKDGYAAEAAAIYQRSFAGRLRLLGQNAPETLSSMLDLAAIKVSLGDLEAALLLLEKAVSTLDTVFGVQNEMTLKTMDKLSILYHKLGLDKESRIISAKIIPHCRTFFGINSPITRDAVTRYVETSENFDFSAEIKDVLDQYRRSREAESLRVIHRLGRSYMDAGLNRDAAELFETLLDDLAAIRGTDSRATIDALSALCVCHQHLGDVERAIDSYTQLIEMARGTHREHHSRKRIEYAESRIAELVNRRKVLAAERREWGLSEPGACANCGCFTTVLCNTCKITPFCTATCQKLSSHSHTPWCIPSITPRESKSITVKPTCPVSVLNQATFQITSFERDDNTITTSKNNNNNDNDKHPIKITASYTFYLDPRNFATVRMKLKEHVNTVVVFSSTGSEGIRYAILGSASASESESESESRGYGHGHASLNLSSNSGVAFNLNPNHSSSSVYSGSNTGIETETETESELGLALELESGSESESSTESESESKYDMATYIPNTDTDTTPDSDKEEFLELEWITPQSKPSFHFTPSPLSQSQSQSQSRFLSQPQPQTGVPTGTTGKGTYLLITPGPEMLTSLINRRLRIRSGNGERERFSALEFPDTELIEFAQGLLLKGYLGEAFMYVVEWV